MALPRSFIAGIAACAAVGICTSALAQRPIESAPGVVAAPELKRALPAQAQPARRDIRRPPAARLLITTANALPAASRGKSYSQALMASGAAPHVWSVIRGRLPAGLTLSPTGVLSGTPIVIGKFSFAVRVRDSTGATTTKGFALAVGSQAAMPAPSGKRIGISTPLTAAGFAGPAIVPKRIAIVTPLSATGFTGPPVAPKTIPILTPLTANGF